MAFEQKKGCVIHKKPFQETSLLVSILLECGQLKRFLVKGAHRPKSRFRGLLEPFAQHVVTWRQKGSGLATLQSLDLAYPPLMLPKDAFFAGMYLNELLYRMGARYEFQDNLLTIYWQILQALSEQTDQVGRLCRQFEMAILASIGFGVDCSVDRTGQPIDPNRTYQYRAHEGFCLAPEGILGASIRALAQQDWQTVPSSEWKLITRSALRPHIGPEPLHTKRILT